MRLFLDTNVLIDYYARREPFYDDALKLRIAAFFGDVDLWVCTQSFVDAEYILRKAVPITELRSMMAASLEFLNVAAPLADQLPDALASNWPDLEDCLIAHCARNARADFLVTRDTLGFANAPVPVLTPHGVVERLEGEGISYDEVAL